VRPCLVKFVLMKGRDCLLPCDTGTWLEYLQKRGSPGGTGMGALPPLDLLLEPPRVMSCAEEGKRGGPSGGGGEMNMSLAMPMHIPLC